MIVARLRQVLSATRVRERIERVCKEKGLVVNQKMSIRCLRSIWSFLFFLSIRLKESCTIASSGVNIFLEGSDTEMMIFTSKIPNFSS